MSTSHLGPRYPRSTPATFVAAAAIAWLLGPTLALAQSAGSQAERDRAALRQFPEVNRLAKDLSPAMDKAARNHAESSAQRATGNSATVTSRDRPQNSPIASRAHDRGAVDVVTPNMKQDASRISKAAGPGYTTIHEQPVRSQPRSRYAPDREGERVFRAAKCWSMPYRFTGPSYGHCL